MEGIDFEGEGSEAQVDDTVVSEVSDGSSPRFGCGKESFLDSSGRLSLCLLFAKMALVGSI